MDTTSILESIKGRIGVENDTEFDDELIPLINAELSSLYMIGIGPADGFAIKDRDDLWSSFTSNGVIKNLAMEYIALRVGLIFDPPTNSFVNESKKRKADELEWRLRVLGEPGGWDK